MSKIYKKGITEIANGTLNFVTANIGVLLVNTSHAFTKTDEFVANVSSNEISGTGYERKTLSNQSVTYDLGNDILIFDGDDVLYSGIDVGTVASAIIFQEGANDDVSTLIADVNFDDFTTVGEDAALIFDANGIFTITSDVT